MAAPGSIRRSDRLSAAGLRAVAANPEADLRGRRLVVGRTPLLVVVPYLGLGDDGSASGRRGVVDGLGLRVRHSDPELHRRLSPEPILERIVFDIAEQFRCESLVDPALSGVIANTTSAFDAWSERSRADRVAETGVGLLVYTITHMIRARLLRQPVAEQVAEIIEVTRGNLARLAGHALGELSATAHSQTEFSVPAKEIAHLVAEMVADADESLEDSPESVRANTLLASLDWDLIEELASAPDPAVSSPAPTGDYAVFTTDYDVEVRAAALYRSESLRSLRAELEQHRADQVVSVTRLTQRLRILFDTWHEQGWLGATEDGALDPTRLAQVVADPTNRLVHRQPRRQPTGDAAVTFLIDTSGSMKAQRYESVAVLTDTLVRALEPAGVVTEVLGFTTGGWAGGRAASDWRSQGSPADPGRLNEVQHIIYKDFGQSWRQARFGIAAMLRTEHYREGIDGEALIWAHNRLAGRQERRRVLVMISDGHPMDAATSNNNRDGFLADHLRSVAAGIESTGQVELGSIGVDEQLDEYITRSVSLDLEGTLTIGSYDVLHRLFG